MSIELKQQSVYKVLADSVSHLKWHELAIGILLSSLFINCLGLIMPLMLLQFFDRIIPNQSINTLHILIAIVVIAIVLENILKILRASVCHWATAKYEHHAGVDAFKQLLKLKPEQFKKHGTGTYLDKMSDLFSMKDFYGGQALSLLIDLPFVVIYLSLIIYIGGWLVLIPVMMLALFVASANIMGNKMQKQLSQRKDIDDRRFNFIIEILSSIQTIKTYAMESFMLRRYERLQQGSVEKDKQIAFTNTNSMMISQYLSQLNTILIVGFGSIIIMHGNLSIGALAACTLLANRCLAPMGSAMVFWKRLQAIVVSQQRLEQLKPESNQGEVIGKISPKKLHGDIILKNITFSFDKQQPLFRNLSLHVPEKSCIAISGAGSSGKTALLKIILGLYQPQQGHVKIDGTPVYRYDLSWLRQKIAYLPQKSHLFNGSLLDNLSLFDKKNIPKAISLVEQMDLQHEIHRLAEGYDTHLGQGIVDGIPTGVKQQVTCLQNLLDDPDIILFDEANSAVDYTSDQCFLRLLKHIKGKKTLIIVSHRPSLTAIADNHYQLVDGQLKIKGNHE